MKIVAHPANIDALKKAVNAGQFNGQMIDKWDRFDVINLISNPSLPQTRPSGKYRLPGGAELTREEFTLRTRFFEYGPEDLDWLVMAGVVEECQEMHFYIVKDSAFQLRMDLMPMLFEPRSLVKMTCT